MAGEGVSDHKLIELARNQAGFGGSVIFVDRGQEIIQGKIFGNRYECLEPIGQGGMASVYLAHDQNLKRHVALKVMHEHMKDRKPLRARFQREAYSVSKLKHPNILEIYDSSGENSEELWLVMERIEGYDLNDYVACFPKQTIHPLVATCIIREVAKALSEAHKHGIIHRDVKASNIMVSYSGQIKLMDFGIAKDLIVDSELTQTGSFIGSPSYMPPEQIRGEAIDARADLYAMSVLFFKLITGRYPYEGQNTHEIMDQVLSQPIPKPKSLKKSIPSYLSQFIVKGLAKEAKNRHQDSHQMVVALDEYLRESHFGDSGVELGLFFSDPKEFSKKIHKNFKSLRSSHRFRDESPLDWNEIKKAHHKISLVKNKKKSRISSETLSKDSGSSSKGKNSSKKPPRKSRGLDEKRVKKLKNLKKNQKPSQSMKKGGVPGQGTIVEAARQQQASESASSQTQRSARRTLNKPLLMDTQHKHKIRKRVAYEQQKSRKQRTPSTRLRRMTSPRRSPYRHSLDKAWLWVAGMCLFIFSAGVVISYQWGPQFYPLGSKKIDDDYLTADQDPKGSENPPTLSSRPKEKSAMKNSVQNKKSSSIDSSQRSSKIETPKPVKKIEKSRKSFTPPKRALVSRKPMPAKPIPIAVGSVKAFVNPNGEVYLGSKFYGQSSRVFKGPLSLKVGSYQLKIKKQGYETYQRDILIKDRQILSLGKINLRKITYYSLAVQGPKGTKFSVKRADGRYLKSLTLVSSEYRLRLQRGDYEIIARRQGKIFRRQIKLPSMYGNIVVSLVF